jgi:hypothetical protein
VYCTAPNLDQQANSPAKRFYIILNIFEYGASRRLYAAQLLAKKPRKLVLTLSIYYVTMYVPCRKIFFIYV